MTGELHSPLKETVALPLPPPGRQQALCVMVMGTHSGAGKSWITTALCAWYRAQGWRVAPFKAQNMSNHARVVTALDGSWGEIGTAQYLQALAAGVQPDVRMNPLLLKPEADQRSQVVLLGQVEAELSRLPWRERAEHVWPVLARALDELRAENDVVVIEGAGSPAEINLMDSDVVNLRVARHAQAHVLLVADIDRGGAFAHLYGTWALLPEADRALLRGFVLNQFRGDARLLAPAPQRLQALTGIPTVALVPKVFRHGLPQEDGVLGAQEPEAPGAPQRTVAVVRYPRASNLDEFEPLRHVPGLRLVWADTPAQVEAADWVILPGSKSTVDDLQWMRCQGLDASVVRHALRGGWLWGVCGGLQMLGEALIDPEQVHGNAAGLGVLPLVTVFAEHKRLARQNVTLPVLPGAWQALGGLHASVYEIHQGRTAIRADLQAAGDATTEPVPGVLWLDATGRVLGCYWHGLLETPAVLRAALQSIGWQGDAGAQADLEARSLPQVFERMAQGVAQWFGPQAWTEAAE